MWCWCCMFYEYCDYQIDNDGNEEGYGICGNIDSECYEEEVRDNESCDESIVKGSI